MVNYENSKVYKIWSTQGDKIYIGSTTKQYLSQRMDKHRTDYKRWKDNRSNFITSFKIFEEYGLENCFIELLEAKICNSKDELKQLEGKYIRELACVNKSIAGRTEKQYREDSKEKKRNILKKKKKK
jgi:predicted GIY-YIG superfamily endonuclease